MKCKYCEREFHERGVKYHERYCKLNPNKLEQNSKTEKWLISQKTKKKSNQWISAKENNEIYVISDETRNKWIISSTGRRCSEETRKLISIGRKEFLKNNPDKVPYLMNHYSLGRSYPEQYFKGILDSNKIEYEEQYKIATYYLDFAILSKKIDFEIDGDQHYLDKRIVESDKRRNEFLQNNGWTIIRIKWSDYCKLKRKEKEEIIDKLLIDLS